MARQSSGIPLSGIELDTRSEIPLYIQLYKGISEMIFCKTLKIGDRLPSSREIASDLDISRSTVSYALDLLISEGFIETHDRSGAYVSNAIHTELDEFNKNRLTAEDDQIASPPKLSSRGERLRIAPDPDLHIEDHIFDMGVPDFKSFPIKLWSSLYQKRLRSLDMSSVTYGDPAGYLPLRKNISRHLLTTRGIKCHPDQILITSGVQQATNLISSILLDKDDAVWVENPGPWVAESTFTAHGCKVIPVPVDQYGLVPDDAKDIKARLAFVTPTKHHPLNMPMSLDRRMKLLNWANQENSWIVEDDYSSEFRYEGPPLTPLYTLDTTSRVIYLGTFSKGLMPSLRIGYMVLPVQLAPIMVKGMSILYRSVPTLEQQVLSDFIEFGHFAKHTRRLRKLYGSRQKHLVKELRTHLSDHLSVEYSPSGFHIVAFFKDQSINEQDYKLYCESRKLAPQVMGYYHSGNTPYQKGLLLGFAGTNSEEVSYGISVLKDAFKHINSYCQVVT